VVAPGFKYNIPDILSALGRVQLGRAAELLSMREEIACLYDEAFRLDENHFILPHTGPGDARHLYPLRLNLAKLSVSRNEFAEKIQKQGIGISVHFIPLHTMPYYKKRYSTEDRDFPETLMAYNCVISLPIWPGMNLTQINRVIKVVKDLAFEYNKGTSKNLSF
jgi:dTDP-4-amino-4,6-dideoxygalactose transaminase